MTTLHCYFELYRRYFFNLFHTQKITSKWKSSKFGRTEGSEGTTFGVHQAVLHIYSTHIHV